MKFDSASYMYTLALLLFVGGAGLLLWYGGSYLYRRLTTVAIAHDLHESISAPSACVYRRLLDGVCVASADAMNPPSVAVMVENSRDAWPLSGIALASVVYEAPAESNIPRFLLLYPQGISVDQVGPVRSSRPYFLDWVEEYGAPMYLHVGGSPEALQRIDAENIFDLNEINRGWYFWRADTRLAPHNAYTSSKLWDKAFEQYGSAYPTSTFTPWTFASSSQACDGLQCVSNISVALSSVGMYKVGWQFSTSTDSYVRFQGDTPQLDDIGTPVLADTIIIQRVHADVVDEIGRKHIDTVGTGEAIIFHDGEMVRGHWEKTDVKSRTQWLDLQNNSIPLKSGKIWIEIMPQYGVVSW